jgi:hypothetical protein
MGRRQRVRKASTDKLVLRPDHGPAEKYGYAGPGGVAVQTGGTLALYAPGGGLIRAVGYLDVPTIDTTITSAALEGASTIVVDSVTNLVTGGPAIWIGTPGLEALDEREVTGVVTSTKTVTLNRPLQYEHASGQRVISAELSSALTAVETATLGENYRAVWTHVHLSQTVETVQLFDVVLHPFRLPLSPYDIISRIPDSILRGASEVSAEQMIDSAEEDLIKDLERRGLRVDLIRNCEQFRGAGIAAIRRNLAEREVMISSNPMVAVESLKIAQNRYDDEVGAACQRLDWYDLGEDDIAENSEDVDGDGVSEYGTEEVHVSFPNYMIRG